jgi:hypothetical protein
VTSEREEFRIRGGQRRAKLPAADAHTVRHPIMKVIGVLTLLLISCAPATKVHDVPDQNRLRRTKVSVKSDLYQRALKARVASQEFIEDSSLVFWTQYPDPFCCPCPKNTIPVSQAISFYCDMPGSLEIGILDCESDSIIHKFNFPRDERQNYTFWPCCFSTNIDIPSLKTYHRPLSEPYLITANGPFKFILTLDNREKAIFPYHIRFPKNHYCFITLVDMQNERLE